MCKKNIGKCHEISKATPKQLRQIEKCSILASGGTPNPKVFGKSKKNIKKNTSKKTIRNLSEPLAPSKF